MTSPTATLYCLPPVFTIAYISGAGSCLAWASWFGARPVGAGAAHWCRGQRPGGHRRPEYPPGLRGPDAGWRPTRPRGRACSCPSVRRPAVQPGGTPPVGGAASHAAPGGVTGTGSRAGRPRAPRRAGRGDAGLAAAWPPPSPVGGPGAPGRATRSVVGRAPAAVPLPGRHGLGEVRSRGRLGLGGLVGSRPRRPRLGGLGASGPAAGRRRWCSTVPVSRARLGQPGLEARPRPRPRRRRAPRPSAAARLVPASGASTASRPRTARWPPVGACRRLASPAVHEPAGRGHRRRRPAVGLGAAPAAATTARPRAAARAAGGGVAGRRAGPLTAPAGCAVARLAPPPCSWPMTGSVETMTPRPRQCSQVVENSSSRPWPTRLRVICTRPSEVTSETWCRVRSRPRHSVRRRSTRSRFDSEDHVDEVDDDHAADVAQPELADDLLGGLEVVAGDRLLEVAAGAGELAGVDVDDGHRLGAVDDQGAARGQPHLAVERLGQLLVDAVRGEHVARAGVAASAAPASSGATCET